MATSLAAPRVDRVVAPAAAACVAALRQAEELLARIAVDTFCAESALLPGGSIGKHLRHVLEFHAALERGLAARVIDYSLRARARDVETRPDVARTRLRAAIAWLSKLTPQDMRRPVLVIAEEGQAAPCDSTLARELAFLESHAIHHLALVGVLLRVQGVEPPESLGVAPSTLAAWREAKSWTP
jgi:uncharacterized damage-inducible protein DinB